VPPALEEIRAGGKVRARNGTACEELAGDRAREFLERRRGYDWSSEPSGIPLSKATGGALASARAKYRATKGVAPASNLELVRRLGVVTSGGSDLDPEMTRAGALLLAPFEPDIEQIVALDVVAEGRPSRHAVRGAAPMLELFDAAWSMLTDKAFPEAVTVVGANRRLMRAIPDYALREALVNAIMHRDYRLERSAITVHAIDGKTFKVRSPGGFVSGVRPDRLITAPSNARNPCLAAAMRTLGLAEREGVGVDIMYEQMLRSGHRAPDIVEADGAVVVTLRGGQPDTDLIAYFDELAGLNPSLDGVRAAMAVTTLFRVTPLRAEELAASAQCTALEANQSLTDLETAGVLRRLVNAGHAYALTDHTRNRFKSRLRYTTRRALDQHFDLVRAYLDSHVEIGRGEAAVLLDLAVNSTARLLGDLTRQGKLVPVANARGAGVRYRLPD
jgi:ATP-dependent DNA helicase RecG